MSFLLHLGANAQTLAEFLMYGTRESANCCTHMVLLAGSRARQCLQLLLLAVVALHAGRGGAPQDSYLGMLTHSICAMCART